MDYRNHSSVPKRCHHACAPCLENWSGPGWVTTGTKSNKKHVQRETKRLYIAVVRPAHQDEPTASVFVGTLIESPATPTTNNGFRPHWELFTHACRLERNPDRKETKRKQAKTNHGPELGVRRQQMQPRNKQSREARLRVSERNKPRQIDEEDRETEEAIQGARGKNRNERRSHLSRGAPVAGWLFALLAVLPPDLAVFASVCKLTVRAFLCLGPNSPEAAGFGCWRFCGDRGVFHQGLSLEAQAQLMLTADRLGGDLTGYPARFAVCRSS